MSGQRCRGSGKHAFRASPVAPPVKQRPGIARSRSAQPWKWRSASYNEVFQSETKSFSRSIHACEAYRHSHGRRRRAGLEFRHQIGGIPRQRNRLRSHRHPPRLGRSDPRQPAGPGQPGALYSAAESRKHPHHRPHRRHLPAQFAHQPLEDEESCRRCWKGRLSRARNPPRRASLPRSSTSPGGAQEYRDAGPGLPDRHRRRRHAELCGRAGPAGHAT